MNRTLGEASKERSQRWSSLLREYMGGLDSEHTNLVAERDFLQAWIDLIERQRGNLQEAIEIEKKLAEMGQRSPNSREALDGLPKGEPAITP